MSTEAPEALIHLRVAAERKNRWVRQAQAEGKKLTDWIVEKVERDETRTQPPTQAPRNTGQA